MTTKTITPKTTLVQCPCPRCYLGAHYQPELAEKYRRFGELERENAKLCRELAQARKIIIKQKKEASK